MAQPEKTFKAGGITANVFANEVTTKNGKVNIPNVSLRRSYIDKEGKPQHTSSLRANDIPKAELVLAKAYEYMISDSKAE